MFGTQVWANSVDPDKTAPDQCDKVYKSVCMFWMPFSMLKPHCSNLSIITGIFSGLLFTVDSVSVSHCSCFIIRQKNKESCVYCNMPPKNWVGRSGFFFFFNFFFFFELKCICWVVIMLQKRDFIAIISVCC